MATGLLSFRAALLGIAFSTCGYCQKSGPVSPAGNMGPRQHEGAVSELPTRRLKFTAGDPISGINASPVIITPTQCTPDGVLFLDMLQPPSFMQQAIYSVAPKGGHDYPLSSVGDLHGTELISFFPTERHVTLLVRATRGVPLAGEGPARQSSYRFFAVVFATQGGYRKSVELSLHDVLPSHIAELSSGEFLVTGYDRANDMPRLYLVAEDGTIIRPLELPEQLGRYIPSADPNSAKGMMNRSRVLGSILMTGHGDRVLIWRRGGTGTLLSIGAQGSSREISLQVPEGTSVADVLPSDKLWVVHLQSSTSPTPDLKQTSYYQFDPADGRLTARLILGGDTPDHIPATIACEEEGILLSSMTDDQGQTRLLSAR